MKKDTNVFVKVEEYNDLLDIVALINEKIKDARKILGKIYDLKNLIPVEYYVHHLFIDYKFDYKEIIKLFKSDSGKHIDSNTHKLTKNKNYLIITKND
mgnify:CR=1 FL=1